MNLKQITKCTLWLVLLFPLTAQAQTIGKPNGKPVEIPIKGGKPKPETGKPKAPAMDEVRAVYYDAGHKMVFSLSKDIAYLSVEVENLISGETHYGNVDASYPVMDIYLEPSSYTITCTSDDGSLYYGDFVIN